MLLLNQYDRLLEQTLFSPESNSDDYVFFENQFLSVTPAKEKALPTSVSLLHQFVENNAVNIPEKTAFEFAFGVDADNLQMQTWSYRQFNEDGNRIAHFLQSKGVNPGGMIAICFDKCPEASIAILGILKAGCAYLAIDPSAPISRKQFIMEDSNSKVMLCSLPKKLELGNLTGVEIHALDEPGIYQDFPVVLLCFHAKYRQMTHVIVFTHQGQPARQRAVKLLMTMPCRPCWRFKDCSRRTGMKTLAGYNLRPSILTSVSLSSTGAGVLEFVSPLVRAICYSKICQG